METRLGLGEFESTALKVRSSEWAMRYRFLKALVDLRRPVLEPLLQLAVYDELPAELLKEENADFTLDFIYTYTFRGNPLKAKIHPTFLDTPFQHYLSFIRGQNRKLNQMKREAATDKSGGEHDLTRNLVNQLVSGWASLKKFPSSKPLRNSLKQWASANNLDYEWVLDFVLLIYSSLFVAITALERRKGSRVVGLQSASTTTFSFKSNVGEAIWYALREFRSLNFTHTLLNAEHTWQPARFDFVYPGFHWKTLVWHPFVETRAEFLKASIEDFNSQTWAMLELETHRDVPNVNEMTSKLEAYCDGVESVRKVSRFTQPFAERYQHRITLLSAIWNADTSRENFISQAVQQYIARVNEYIAAAKSLRQMNKNTFQTELRDYCKSVLREVPEGYSRVPTKYNPGHFSWLVEYQIPPFKTFEEIAESIAPTETKPAAVEKAVRRIATKLGISLRPTGKTGGRPRGVKEMYPRRRVSKND